jgi:hypothetical protein
MVKIRFTNGQQRNELIVAVCHLTRVLARRRFRIFANVGVRYLR